MKKIAYIFLVLGIIFTTSGGVSTFLIGLRKENESINARVEKIEDIFVSFTKITNKFENFKDNLSKEYLNTNIDKLKNDDNIVKNKFKDYESIINDLEKEVKKLSKLCDNTYYANTNTNSKCVNYKTIYEYVNNHFVKDVNIYNEKIKGLENIKKYKTNRKILDYNENGEKEGIN